MSTCLQPGDGEWPALPGTRSGGRLCSCLPPSAASSSCIPRDAWLGQPREKAKAHLTSLVFHPPPEAAGRHHAGAGHREVLEMLLLLRLLLVWIRMGRWYGSERENEQAADISLKWVINEKGVEKNIFFICQREINNAIYWSDTAGASSRKQQHFVCFWYKGQIMTKVRN